MTSVDDLQAGYRDLPTTDAVRLGLGDDARIICRPSGTEPKLKCYVEVVVPVTGEVGAARASAEERIAAIKTDLAVALGLE